MTRAIRLKSHFLAAIYSTSGEFCRWIGGLVRGWSERNGVKLMERSKKLLLLCLLMGCGTPETRFLTWQPRPARLEVQSYELHDPFPDEDAGPKTGVRPRIFLEPRSDTRKNLDLRYINAAYGFPQRPSNYWDPAAPFGPGPSPVQPVWRATPAARPGGHGSRVATTLNSGRCPAAFGPNSGSA